MRALRTTFVASVVLAASCATPPPALERVAKVTQAADWSGGAAAPVHIRQGHTATLLGNGDVLVAGGGAAPKTTEIIDSWGGTVKAGPDLTAARTNHTATMLLTGKVLLAGGKADSENTASAELFDPVTRTTAATGAMATKRGGPIALRLRSGKVLVSGGSSDATTEIYDPAAGTWSPGPTRGGNASLRAMTTLADGRVLALSDVAEVLDADGTAWTQLAKSFAYAEVLVRMNDGRIAGAGVSGAGVLPGGEPSFITSTELLAADLSNVSDGPGFKIGRTSFAAVRTVEGYPLFLGGRNKDAPDPELLVDTAATKLTSDGPTASGHEGATATLLPGGDVLLIGGTQARIDRRPSPGTWAQGAVKLTHGREGHAATRLRDGRVLIAGGEMIARAPSVLSLDAEILDAAAGTSTAVPGGLATSHLRATFTTLRDGRAILAGGGTADVAIYTPEGSFAAGPPLAVSRAGHAATLLPSGRLFVVGGTKDAAAAELFDPSTNAWTSGPTPAHAFASAGAVLMPNGHVLVVGGGDAEIFDEHANAFRAAPPPGGSRDGRTARLLANGKVFVSGGASLAADLFDPATETWSFSAPLPVPADGQLWTPVPSGKLVGTGGMMDVFGGDTSNVLFDPIAHPSGAFFTIAQHSHGGHSHSATLAGTGEVVHAGGENCTAECVAQSSEVASIYRDGADPALRPTITNAPATVTAGTKVQIAGTGFANGAEASDGTRAASAVNHPVAVWVSDAGDAVIPSRILDFTDTTATWLVPTTALYGHGLLFVNVAGVFSRGFGIDLVPALAATACSYDAECGTGFCADEVCCDRRCDGTCEACTKAKKTSGEDGVCGAVPPGVGTCILKLGDACQGGNECGTGFCAQGVCCDSTCDGQCLACNLQGKVGRCSAINEGACGAACDGDHTLKQIGVPDVDCAPYKCGGPQCNQTCASARDCVAPAVCGFDGHCVPPVVPPAGNDTVCGCTTVGAPARSFLPSLLALLPMAIAVRRRARARKAGSDLRKSATL